MACLLMILGIILVKVGAPSKDGSPSGAPWLSGVGAVLLLVSLVWWVGFGLDWWDTP